MTMMLGSYALMCTVPIAELMINRLGVHIPVVWMAYVFLVFGWFITGRIGEFWQAPLAKPFMILLVLQVVAAVFGNYPSRSLGVVVPYGFRFHILPFFCCAIALSTKQVRHILAWVGWGAFLLLGLCIVYGQLSDDRLIIPGGSLENPNDLGFAILFVMTGMLVLESKVSRLIVLITLPVFFVYLLKTGSRADVITLAGCGVVAFYFAPRNWKMVILVLAPVVAAGTIAVVPNQNLARIATIFKSSSAETNDYEIRGAMDSAAARAQLQGRAIELSIRHPLLGVGVGNFEDAVDEMVQSTLHEKSGWQVAHNTYLQVAAENGLPAFTCYLWSLLVCLKMNFRSYKACREAPALSNAATQSFALILMTFMFLICTAFSNNSCDPRLGVLIALSAANYLAVQRELRAAQHGITPGVEVKPLPWNQPGPSGRRVPALQTTRPVAVGLPSRVSRESRA
jgi:O-antigen ligase